MWLWLSFSVVLTEDPTDFCTENIYDHEGSFVLKRASAPSLAAEKSENVEENETQNDNKYALLTDITSLMTTTTKKAWKTRMVTCI